MVDPRYRQGGDAVTARLLGQWCTTDLQRQRREALLAIHLHDRWRQLVHLGHRVGGHLAAPH